MFSGMVYAQSEPVKTIPSASIYNNQEAFAPLFYMQNGNEYRSASGIPGARYWPNRN